MNVYFNIWLGSRSQDAVRDEDRHGWRDYGSCQCQSGGMEGLCTLKKNRRLNERSSFQSSDHFNSVWTMWTTIVIIGGKGSWSSVQLNRSLTSKPNWGLRRWLTRDGSPSSRSVQSHLIVIRSLSTKGISFTLMMPVTQSVKPFEHWWPTASNIQYVGCAVWTPGWLLLFQLVTTFYNIQ